MGLFEIPELKEFWDILLVVLVGIAVLLLQRFMDLFEDAPGIARSLWSACFVYAATQFLTNHAEAQGVMLSVLWVVGWHAATKREWKIVTAVVVLKILLLLLLIRSSG